MKNVDLSVIVACYNIEDYIEPCLDSIANTEFPQDNLEVLMVDDGSTDNTGKIVDRYAARYPNFIALHKKNDGVSNARNYGIDHASGKYIAFVDGDDLVTPNAYPDLMYVAEANHSDVVAGFVHRFDSLRNHGSYLHKFAIKDNRYNVTLDTDHDLLYDTTTWNKVYRRNFLNQNHIRFIPHIIYEDLPFTMTVHLDSKRTSTIKDVVYYWRWRPNSITQSRDAFSNFLSRINALDLCRRKLINAGYGPNTSMFKDFERKILLVDLNIFLENIGDSEESYIYKVQELTYRFLRDWHLLKSPLLKTLPIKNQILYYAIRTGNLELLKKYTYTKKIGEFKVSPVTKHYQFQIPELGDSDVLKHINVRSNVMRIRQKINRIHVNRDKHLIYGNGMFRIRRMPLFKKRFSIDDRHERLSAELINLDNHRRMEIPFSRRRTPTYKRILRPHTAWTNSRYNFSFNYVKCIQRLGLGTWIIQVNECIDGKYQVSACLADPIKERRELFKPIESGRHFIADSFNTNWELTFKVAPLGIVGAKDTNWISKPVVKGHQLQFKAGLVHSETITPVIETANQKMKLVGRIVSDPAGDYRLIFDLTRWRHWSYNHPIPLYLIHTRTNHQVKYRFLFNHHRQILNVSRKQQALVVYNSRQFIRVLLNYRPLVITKCTLVNHRGLKVHARFPWSVDAKSVDVSSIKIGLITKHKTNRYVLATKSNHIRMRDNGLDFWVPILSRNFKTLLILSGKYRATIYVPINHHVISLKMILTPSLAMPHLKQLPIKTKDIVKYRVHNDADGYVVFRVKQPGYGFSRKRSRRALGYSLIYPLMRLLPLRNVMVFDSYWASQFSSNERAMYEYMQKHHPNVKTVWFFRNRLKPITYHGERVKVNTLKYWYYMATARYLIQNTNLPNQYFKRSGQIEVETLHGTFLKHMGFDEPHFRTASRTVQDSFARRIRRWDYMLVPSKYMDRIASRAFDYHQKVLPFGFPRNDSLIRNDRPGYIKAIKLKLGIPLDKKVILYAPTYRKGQLPEFHLDLKRLQESLSDRYVLLVRLHYFVAHTHSFYQYPNFVYDASDYPDINDLFLISDVLVTDYSSVMFDYAYLKRPMIFYAYDKDYYLNDDNRGVYLHYDRDMPGPIVTTQDGLTKALLNLNNVKTKYHQAIIHFYNRFAQYGRKGDATKRSVEAILHTRKADLDQEPDRHVIFNKFWHWFKIHDLQSKLLNYLGSILPKRNIIMFESFFGTKYSDNPKALYLYIKKHYPNYKLYWNVNPEDIPYFKQHHIPYIKRFGYRGIFKQAQAKYWITNARRPFRWNVPRNTIVLQTWHGTPLKTIGHDVNLVTMPGNNVQKYHRQVYKDNRRWDYLIAPNMYSEHIMTRAFRKDANQMMLTGYPRNDILVNATPSYVKSIKKRLGIPAGKTVVLYAPTWRDNEYVKSDEFTAHLHLDLDLFRKHYGNQVVVLVRTHYMISNQLDLSNYRDIAINVSDYQDIADLYLISDVLITDYSSVMFDYAILKRPMIFFDYDFAKYAESTRGFYFDFKQVAPGPIVTTTGQVIQKLDDILAGHWRMNENYRKFVERFNKWMDGNASARVTHQLLNEDNVREHYLTRHELGLPERVRIKDGASMWMPDKDFKDRFDVNFYQNYDKDRQRFKVVKGMQLESTSFNQLIGMKYVLVKNPNLDYDVWVNLDDVIKDNEN